MLACTKCVAINFISFIHATRIWYSGCSSQGFSWSPSNRYLNGSKLASTRLCNNHIINDIHCCRSILAPLNTQGCVQEWHLINQIINAVGRGMSLKAMKAISNDLLGLVGLQIMYRKIVLSIFHLLRNWHRPPIWSKSGQQSDTLGRITNNLYASLSRWILCNDHKLR